MAGDVSEKRQANIDKEVCRDDETVSKSVAKQSTVTKKNEKRLYVPMPHPATAQTPRGGTVIPC